MLEEHIVAAVQADHGLVIFEIRGETDDAGMTAFFIHRYGYHPTAGYGLRSQAFHASLERHVEGVEADGKTVRRFYSGGRRP